jgi:hypothetical protein
LGKTYGSKSALILGTPLGITLGTWWESIANLKGTCWEQRKNEKNPLPPPYLPLSQNLKEKINSRHVECMLSLPIGCMKCFISKTVRHHFWPGLIPPL